MSAANTACRPHDARPSSKTRVIVLSMDCRILHITTGREALHASSTKDLAE